MVEKQKLSSCFTEHWLQSMTYHQASYQHLNFSCLPLFSCSSPSFAAAWMNFGIVQAALGKEKEAEESYKTAIKHRHKYPDAYYNLGNLVSKSSHIMYYTNIAILDSP